MPETVILPDDKYLWDPMLGGRDLYKELGSPELEWFTSEVEQPVRDGSEAAMYRTKTLTDEDGDELYFEVEVRLYDDRDELNFFFAARRYV